MIDAIYTPDGNFQIEGHPVPADEAAQYALDNGFYDQEPFDFEDLLGGRYNIFIVQDGVRRFLGIATAEYPE